MNPNKIILLYDNETEVRLGTFEERSVHLAAEPVLLAKTLALYGGQQEITVLVSEHDPAGKRFVKYGAEVVPVNGNRRQVLAQRLPNLLENIRRTSPWLLIVISRDPSLAGLLEAAAAHCVVIAFSPGEKIPSAYQEAAERARQRGERLDTRLLSDLLFAPRKPCVRLFVDGENLLGCYKDLQLKPQLSEMYQALHQICERYGRVSTEMYVADWGQLPEGTMLRDGLAACGAEICQVDSRRGKNSSDHVLVAEATHAMDRTDVLVVFSNDTDLRHLFRDARSRGVRVISVGTHPKLTEDLRAAADESIYLDDLIPALRAPAVHLNGKERQLILSIAAWEQANSWKWIPADQLYACYGIQSEDRQLLDQLIRDGHLKPANHHPVPALELNLAEASVRAAFELASWIPEQVRDGFAKGLPFISSGYLITRMRAVPVFQHLGLTVDDNTAGSWIEAAARAGLIRMECQPDPRRPGKMIKMCQLPEKKPQKVFSQNQIENLSN